MRAVIDDGEIERILFDVWNLDQDGGTRRQRRTHLLEQCHRVEHVLEHVHDGNEVELLLDRFDRAGVKPLDTGLRQNRRAGAIVLLVTVKTPAGRLEANARSRLPPPQPTSSRRPASDSP
jgi:hypothetical protein